MMTDLCIIHEHPEWQKPLFAALDRRGLSWQAFDLKRAAFDIDALPEARLFFNQASPSAYVRGNTRAVPLCLALLRTLEERGARVLNGSRPFALELSKTTQAAMLRRLGIATPKTLSFNDIGALHEVARDFPFPALLKPEQGGSGARMFKVESIDEVERLLMLQPDLWFPDNLLLLQELVDYPRDFGIVRLEVVGGQLLYAMRVVSHGRFNLCPSPVCNPGDGEDGGDCHVDLTPAPPVEFYPYPEVAPRTVDAALRIAHAGGLDVCGLECIETAAGPVFYDINANSNLRPAIGQAFGFDPFERVVDYLQRELAALG
jgi:glutathione synthase/RimK-type ligase-like ATP-grasp enzyme